MSVLRRAAVLMLAATAVVAGFAAPAQAAVPDRFGFVLWNGVAPVASGTFPAATTVTPGFPGRYKIVFPGQGAPGGVVHITAISNVPRWCQVDTWGQVGIDEVVYVSCYRVGGALDVSNFSAVFSRSSGLGPWGGQYGYVDSLGNGVISSQFNSAGAVNTVAHLGVGQYLVRMPGLGSAGPNDGGIQATAVSPNVAARCKVFTWASTPASQDIRVACFNAGGLLVDTRFTTSFQQKRSIYGGLNPPKYFGYAWNRPPLGPPTTNFNSIVGLGLNTIVPAGAGLYLARFPRLLQLPDTVQVTAAGFDSNFCGLNFAWTHSATELVVRDVNCFNNAGVPWSNNGFLITTASAF